MRLYVNINLDSSTQDISGAIINNPSRNSQGDENTYTSLTLGLTADVGFIQTFYTETAHMLFNF